MSFRWQDTPVATVVLQEQNDSHLLFRAKGRRDSRVERRFAPNLPEQRSSRGSGNALRVLIKTVRNSLRNIWNRSHRYFFDTHVAIEDTEVVRRVGKTVNVQYGNCTIGDLWTGMPDKSLVYIDLIIANSVSLGYTCWQYTCVNKNNITFFLSLDSN